MIDGIEADGRRIKVATDRLVDACGKIEAAAADIGKSKSQVQRYTDDRDAVNFINVRDVALLERVAGRPLVTELLCRFAGGVFVPHVDVTADEDTLSGLVMGMAGEVGDVARRVSEAVADQVVSNGEADGIECELDQLDRLSAQMRMAVRARRAASFAEGADGSERGERGA